MPVTKVMIKQAAIVKKQSIAKAAPKPVKEAGKQVKESVKPSVRAKKQTVLVRTVKNAKVVKKTAITKTSVKSVKKTIKPASKSVKASVNGKKLTVAKAATAIVKVSRNPIKKVNKTVKKSDIASVNGKKVTVKKATTANKIAKVSRNPIKKAKIPVKKSIKSEAVGKNKKQGKPLKKAAVPTTPKKIDLSPTKLEKEAIAKTKEFLVERLSHMGAMSSFSCTTDARFRIQKWYLGSAYKYKSMTKVEKRAFYGGFLMTFPANVPTFLVPVGMTETDIILCRLKTDPKQGFMKATEKLSFEEAIARERFIYLPVDETHSPFSAPLNVN